MSAGRSGDPRERAEGAGAPPDEAGGASSAHDATVSAIPPQNVRDFFAGDVRALALFERIRGAVEAIGPAEVRVTRSQVAFRRKRGFAWAWRPGKYLRGERPPLVLSVALPERDPSPRWKQIVEPAPGRWMHHLELRETDEIDGQVERWLRRAWEEASADAAK